MKFSSNPPIVSMVFLLTAMQAPVTAVTFLVTIGEKDSKTVYVVQKLNAKDGEKEYLTKDDSTRKSVLQNMKKDEFGDYINKEAKALKCEVNSSVVDKYDPDMFWEEPEETSTTEPAQ